MDIEKQSSGKEYIKDMIVVNEHKLIVQNGGMIKVDSEQPRKFFNPF